MRGPVFGGSAPDSNQGDFVVIASSAGFEFGNMQHAWLAEAVLDQVAQMPGRIPTIIQPPGDSMIYVNRFGHRFVDEKTRYQDRPNVHFNLDLVRAGDSVRWVNEGTMAHTATGDPDRAADPANAVLPDGAEAWHSGSLSPGDEFVHTFDVPGEYTYACLPHEAAGQVGSIRFE